MKVELPTGTVTFLLTDVVGSSQTWEQDDETAVARAVSRMYEILGEAISAHGGARPVEQGEGDSVVAAFSRTSDAVSAALDAERMIVAEAWPTTEPVLVRMALHTGEALLRDEGNYIGPVLNRCARLRELAHGGQVLLSHATRDLVADNLPERTTLEDLGSHRLRGLERDERIWQLVHPDLPKDFPALRSEEGPGHKGNLPRPLSSFVGREAELAEIEQLLTETRMLTLTGAGGCGKSRLALETAEEVAGSYPDGVWWVDLAPLSDPDLLPASVAAALSIKEPPGLELVEVLRDRLRGRMLLLVFDNCEHLVGDCARLAEVLLSGCPTLTVIATTREPLGVEGETSYRVPSLPLPDTDDAEDLEGFEAVRLFLERSRQAGAEVAADKEVAQICRRLDGMPLAIELAAARARMLSPQQILDGLSDRFGLLTGGRRTALARQRTLQASVDWSYDLLPRENRILLHRLSVFAGSFSMDAARTVCAGDLMPEDGVLDLLSTLVDRSLVDVQDSPDGNRYRLFETIRQYAADKLAASEEASAIRDNHLAYYLALAEEAEAPLEGGPAHHEWLGRLDLELPNLRAASEWARFTAQDEKDYRMASALWFLFVVRSYLSDWAKRVAEQLPPPPNIDPYVRAKFLNGAAWYYFRTGDLTRSRSAHEAGLSIGRELSDDRTIGRSLFGVGFVEYLSVEHESAYAHFEQGITASRAVGDLIFVGLSVSGLGACLSWSGDTSRARPLLEDGVDVSRMSENDWIVSNALFHLGSHLCQIGDYKRAEHVSREGIDICSKYDETWLRSHHLGNLGRAEASLGRLDEAAKTLEQAATVSREINGPLGLFAALVYAGLLDLARGDLQAGASILDEAVALGSAIGVPYFVAQALAADGAGELARGNIDTASARWVEAEELARSTSNLTALSWALNGRALIARQAGDLGRAEVLCLEALQASLGAGLLPEVVEVLERLAGVAWSSGRAEHAARIFGAADVYRQRMGPVRSQAHQPHYSDDLRATREALGDEAFEGAWAEGTELTLEEAAELATRGRGSRARPSLGWDSLTPTELEVSKLVAEGLTNPQIGERLFVSPRTVQSHLRSIFAKLGTSTRSELTKEVILHRTSRDDSGAKPLQQTP